MTDQNLDSVTSCYEYSLSLPAFLISTISITQVHRPTWASPVFFPASLTATRGHLSTWQLLVSVLAYLLPTQISSSFQLRSYFIPIPPTLLLLLLASHESSRVAQSCLFVASWNYHTFFIRPPPSYPAYLGNNSNKGRSANQCATVARCCSM